jgi:TonB family protein
MKEYVQGLGISFLIHGACLAALWTLGASVVTPSRPIEIYFDLVEQRTPSRGDQSKYIQRASSSAPIQKNAGEHIVERKHAAEQPKTDRPLQTSAAEASMPVQAPKEMATVEASPDGPAIMTGQRVSGRADGAGNKGSGKASSFSGADTVDNVPFGSVMGPSFVHRELPEYPFVARRMNKEGKVVLRLTIDETGKLLSVEVIRRAGFGFTEAAIEAVKKSTYSPARIEGKAVVSRALLPVSFELTK